MLYWEQAAVAVLLLYMRRFGTVCLRAYLVFKIRVSREISHRIAVSSVRKSLDKGIEMTKKVRTLARRKGVARCTGMSLALDRI